MKFEIESEPWYKCPIKDWISIDTKSLYKFLWIGPLCLVWCTWEMDSWYEDLREGLRYLSLSYYPDLEIEKWRKVFIDD